MEKNEESKGETERRIGSAKLGKVNSGNWDVEQTVCPVVMGSYPPQA